MAVNEFCQGTAGAQRFPVAACENGDAPVLPPSPAVAVMPGLLGFAARDAG